MTVYVSLLRGINVGGSKILSMDTLCTIYAGLGLTNVRTYLQSGNVVFSSPSADPLSLAGQIESRLEQVSGYSVRVFIRHAGELAQILAHNPFLKDQGIDIQMLHVSFLYRPPLEADWGKLVPPAGIPDRFARGDSVIYTYYPNGYSKAKISAAYFEKLLRVPITDRNWNTVNALLKLATEM